MKKLTPVFSISLFLIICSAIPLSGYSQINNESTLYISASKNHGMCFHKKNGGWDNGNPIHLWSCSEGQPGWKTWVYDPLTGYIHNAERKDKCLHRKENNWNNGNPIHLWDCSAGVDSFKTWDYNSQSGYIKARSNQSKCLHKQQNNWNNGNRIHLWDCDAGTSQMKSWIIGSSHSPKPSEDLVTGKRNERVPARKGTKPKAACTISGKLVGKWRQEISERATGPTSTWTVPVYIYAADSDVMLDRVDADNNGNYRFGGLEVDKRYRISPGWRPSPEERYASCEQGKNTYVLPNFRITGGPLID